MNEFEEPRAEPILGSQFKIRRAAAGAVGKVVG